MRKITNIVGISLLVSAAAILASCSKNGASGEPLSGDFSLTPQTEVTLNGNAVELSDYVQASAVCSVSDGSAELTLSGIVFGFDGISVDCTASAESGGLSFAGQGCFGYLFLNVSGTLGEEGIRTIDITQKYSHGMTGRWKLAGLIAEIGMSGLPVDEKTIEEMAYNALSERVDLDKTVLWLSDGGYCNISSDIDNAEDFNDEVRYYIDEDKSEISFLVPASFIKGLLDEFKAEFDPSMIPDEIPIVPVTMKYDFDGASGLDIYMDDEAASPYRDIINSVINAMIPVVEDMTYDEFVDLFGEIDMLPELFFGIAKDMVINVLEYLKSSEADFRGGAEFSKLSD